MDINNIECFITVAKYLNFTRAAEDHHITQTSMCRKINVLEDELGAPLFFRSKRQVELTPAGREFLYHANKMLETYRNSLIQIQNCVTGFKKELKIAIGTYEHRLIPQTIKHFTDLYPDVEISCLEFRYDTLADQLENDMVDLIVSSSQFFSTFHDIDYFTIYDKPWLLAVNVDNPLAQYKVVSRDLLPEQCLITQNEGSKRQLEESYRFFSKFRQFIQVNSFDTKLLLVAANQGVAVLPRFIHKTTFSNICFVDIDPPYTPRTFFAACKSKNKDLPVRNFMELLRQEFCISESDSYVGDSLLPKE